MEYYILPDVITPDECMTLIKRFELEGTIAQYIDVQEDQQRSGKYTFQNIELTKEFAKRIKSALNLHYSSSMYALGDQWCIRKYWANSGYINEVVHTNIQIGDEVSNYTVLLYLNDDFNGGETIIGKNIKITPKTGSILLIRQDLCHSSKMCYNRFKYILKGDAVLH